MDSNTRWRAAAGFFMAAVLGNSGAQAQTGWGVWAVADAGCTTTQAWYGQENPASEPTGKRNIAYPEANATYWATLITAPIGTVVTINGQFPGARYMGIQVYDEQHNVRGAISDQAINPDAGQNNPYRSGATTALGTYTVRLIFSPTPPKPAANTIYTDGLTQIALVYRVYYSNTPSNLAGGTSNPVLPTLKISGQPMSTCAPRPILPPSATVYGHIDLYNFAGVKPAATKPATNPPTVTLSVTNSLTPYYPSADNNYISALISRQYLSAPYAYNMVVMRMLAPTYPNTQAGEPPYLASSSRQVRYWSVCENEPLTTGVARCLADNASQSLQGYVTYVYSDPLYKPSSQLLSQWGANWLPIGALLSSDVVYDINGNPLGNSDGAYWYGLVLYRQTVANPAWTQSMAAVGQLPRSQWQAAMGAYWPTIGYCSAANFQAYGAGCIGR